MFSFVNSPDLYPSFPTNTNKNQLKTLSNNLHQLKNKLAKSSSIKLSKNLSHSGQKILNQKLSTHHQSPAQFDQKVEQNELRKIKRYSKILQTSGKISNMVPNQTPSSIPQIKKAIIEMSDADMLRQQSLTVDIQKVYNYYALKNQRKNKILAKAKQLGNGNFYRFLKDSSIIETNKHIHRWHSPTKKQEMLGSSTQKLKQLSLEGMTPIVVSFQPIKHDFQRQKKNQDSGLPSIQQKKHTRQRVSLKTQQTQPANESFSFYLAASQGSSQSLTKNTSTQKRKILRSLTEINQKVRRNRKFYQQKDKQGLLFTNGILQKTELQPFLSRWKYKSLFDLNDQSSSHTPKQTKNQLIGQRLKTLSNGQSKFHPREIKTTKYIQQEELGQSKLKFLNISKSKILKKQLSDLSMARNFSFPNKNDT